MGGHWRFFCTGFSWGSCSGGSRSEVFGLPLPRSHSPDFMAKIFCRKTAGAKTSLSTNSCVVVSPSSPTLQQRGTSYWRFPDIPQTCRGKQTLETFEGFGSLPATFMCLSLMRQSSQPAKVSKSEGHGSCAWTATKGPDALTEFANQHPHNQEQLGCCPGTYITLP